LKISVVIATRNRPLLLEKGLRSLADAAFLAQTSGLSFEFVFIINGPDSESLKVIESCLAGCNFKIFQLQTARLPGAARNHALDSLSGDWIFFADDDIYVAHDFFLNFSDTVIQRSEFSVIGGPNLTPPDSSLFQHLSGLALASPFGSFSCSRRYDLRKELRDVDDTGLTLCNLFIKKSALDDIRFSENLVCAEENAILTLLKNAGNRFLAVPELAVFHERRKTYAIFVRQIYKYGRGRGQLAFRGDARWFHFVPVAGLFAVLFFSLNPGRLPVSLFAVAYAACLLIAGASKLRQHQMRYLHLPMLSFLISSIHVFYGFGICHGIFFECMQKIRWIITKSQPTLKGAQSGTLPVESAAPPLLTSCDSSKIVS
jgi:glycosyltransferase involved in cell wall biosynthesis